jgi:hypothetical protein
MAHFLPSGYKFCEVYACRGTMLIEAANLSPVIKLVTGTGAVSRYKLSRSQKFVTVQDFNCVQVRVSGCIYHYKFILGAGAKAKTVTNNLPILSVLCLGVWLSIRKNVPIWVSCPKYDFPGFNIINMQKK